MTYRLDYSGYWIAVNAVILHNITRHFQWSERELANVPLSGLRHHKQTKMIQVILAAVRISAWFFIDNSPISWISLTRRTYIQATITKCESVEVLWLVVAAYGSQTRDSPNNGRHVTPAKQTRSSLRPIWDGLRSHQGSIARNGYMIGTLN